jgi:hypothetical protein
MDFVSHAHTLNHQFSVSRNGCSGHCSSIVQASLWHTSIPRFIGVFAIPYYHWPTAPTYKVFRPKFHPENPPHPLIPTAQIKGSANPKSPKNPQEFFQSKIPKTIRTTIRTPAHTNEIRVVTSSNMTETACVKMQEQSRVQVYEEVYIKPATWPTSLPHPVTAGTAQDKRDSFQINGLSIRL